jgi:cyanophycin synthetase
MTSSRRSIGPFISRSAHLSIGIILAEMGEIRLARSLRDEARRAPRDRQIHDGASSASVRGLSSGTIQAPHPILIVARPAVKSSGRHSRGKIGELLNYSSEESRDETAPAAADALALAADDLRVRSLRVLRGANLWRQEPVIACEVETGRLDATPPSEAGSVIGQLRAAFSGSASDADSTSDSDSNARLDPASDGRSTSDGGSGPDAEDGAPSIDAAASWPEVVGWIAAELQTRAGCAVSFRRVVPAYESEAAVLVGEYVEEEVGVEAVYEAAALVRRVLRGEDAEAERVVRMLRELFYRKRPGPTASLLIEAARARGIAVRRFPGDRVVQLGLGRNLRRLDATMTDFTSVIATDITSDKDRTKRILARFGLPVPDGDVAEDADHAVRIADDLRYPVLVKPLDANDGRGISGRLDDADAVRAAFAIAAAEHPKVVVERFVDGRDHRVVVVDGRVVAVAERVPAHVVGDGRRTIRALAEEVNRDPRRDLLNPTASLVPLPLDEMTERFLARRGHTLDTVPPAGETVWLRGTANISTGGTSVDRTEEIHPRNRTLCELAAGAVGLDVAGMDVLTPDISIPFDENGAAVIEVNASPGIKMHTHPDAGAPRDVPGAILDMLYPPGAATVIPVVAVTGTNGKTTTTRLIAHLLARRGGHVGYTTTDGVYLDGHLLMEGDLTGPFAAGIILSHPRVAAAVLETARGGILRAGLGFDEADVGVVLNVSPDHLGLRGIHTIEQLADVKSVIPAVTKREGHAVLNADDPLVFAMRERTGADIVLFSAREFGENEDVADHVSRGGIAAVVEQGTFVIRRGRLRIPIAAEHDVPLSIGGAARFQRQNVLAAIASAYVQGMRYDDIRAGLLSFFPSPSTTPGRLNLIRVRGGGRVLVDYAHNAAAIAGLVDFVWHTPAAKRFCVLTVPGDRRDDDIRQAGRLCAGFDRVIIKEDIDRRGRGRGEIAKLLTEGLVEGGLDPARIEVLYEEGEAVNRGLDLLGEDDLLVIHADKVPGTLAIVRERAVQGA